MTINRMVLAVLAAAAAAAADDEIDRRAPAAVVRDSILSDSFFSTSNGDRGMNHCTYIGHVLGDDSKEIGP